MKNHRKNVILSALLLLPLLAGCSGTGNSAFFDNQTYNFQVLRVFGQMPWYGARPRNCGGDLQHDRQGGEPPGV